MSALVAFVRARLDEAEAIARTAGDVRPEWQYGDAHGSMQIQTVATHGGLGYEQHLAITHDYEGLSDSVSDYAGPHIALWDPARVLRTIAAHRAILDAHSPYRVRTANDGLNWDYRGCGECHSPEGWEPVQGDWWPCPTLRLLAAVDADQPDYDPAWALS